METIEVRPTSAEPRSKLVAAEIETIRALAARGATAGEIAKVVRRPHPTVRDAMRRLGFLRKATVTIALELPPQTHAALEAAARRRNVKPVNLATALLDGVLRRGAIDRVIHENPGRTSDG